MPIYTNRILQTPQMAVPAVKEAVSQPTPAEPKPITTTGTIPTNVTDGLAKAPTALALQHFPGVGGDAASSAQRTGLGVLNTPATTDGWDELTRQTAVQQLKQADALAQDAFNLVAGRNASHIDQVRAKAEMAEAGQLRQSVADHLAAAYPDKPGFGEFNGERLRTTLLIQDYEQQSEFKQLYTPGEVGPDDLPILTNMWNSRTEAFQQIESYIAVKKPY